MRKIVTTLIVSKEVLAQQLWLVPSSVLDLDLEYLAYDWAHDTAPEGTKITNIMESWEDFNPDFHNESLLAHALEY